MRLLTIVTAASVCLASAAGQSVSFPNFTSTSGLALNGNAAPAGSALRLAASALSQKGTAWYQTPLTVAYGFDTTFAFQTSTPSGGGADGIAFAVHNDARGTTVLGNHASGMGYGAFATSPAGTAVMNSLVVEFDTFAGAFGAFSDLSGNEISVHTGGTGDNSQSEGFSIGRVSPTITFSNAAQHVARIRYFPGTLSVYLDDLVNPVLVVPYDFTNGGTYILSPGGPIGGLALQPGGQAWVGFTAATGGSYENYDLLNWTFESSLLLTATTGGAGTGDLNLALYGLPAATTDGFTLITLDTSGALGTGPTFGIFPDATTFSLLALQPQPGNPLRWLSGFPGLFPDSPFSVPPGVLSFLAGSSWRLVAVAFGPPYQYLKYSNAVQLNW